MSNFPNGYDDDSTLPAVNDNIDDIGGEAINALRDAVVQIEMALGLNIAGTTPNLAARLGVFINSDGTPNTSVLYNLGLVTLPVTNNQIADNAGIPESKLMLDFRTQDLFNYIRDLSKDVNLAIGWISVSGVKLEPHLIGAIYRHDLEQIDVAETSAQFLNNVFRALRDNTDAYTLINDINNELLAHQWADGSNFGIIKDIVTNNGSIYPSNYAHTASGIFLDTAGFSVIPETAQSVQAFADFIDGASILTLGTRIQNLYANGISKHSQSSSLVDDGYGAPIIPFTPAIAYLRGTGNSSSPVDSISLPYGDDIVQFFPTDLGFSFDEQFALVKPGDVITISYVSDGYNVNVPYVISEKQYSQNGGNRTYLIRIAGKNIAYSPNAKARIDRSLYNTNKYGVLSVASATPYNTGGQSLLAGITPSLIIGSPRGAQCTGVGFSADQFNESHYLLYLALYPDGNPLDGYTFLPGIDVTGNQGTTPGSYTLDSIVQATNNAFRQPGFNYRFVAFQFEGEFGIMLADSYNNASFSVVSAVVGGGGFYNQANTQLNFPNNVIDLFPTATTILVGAQTLPTTIVTVASTSGFTTSGSFTIGNQLISYTGTTSNTFTGVFGGFGTIPNGTTISQPLSGLPAPDPLGFGPFAANLASPPFLVTYNSVEAALTPTLLYTPLKRNNYYVNGNERSTFPLDVSQAVDQYGDGYWVATIASVSPLAGHTVVTYDIPLDLSASGLKAGKTLVASPLGTNFGLVNYGRFIIQNVTFTCCPPVQTQITVFDAVHAQGGSPFPVAAVGSEIALYFNASSVSFNDETLTDSLPVSGPFKRHFEIYIDPNGDTFTHERGRMNLGSSAPVNGVTLYGNTVLSKLDLVSISPKLRGYTFGSGNPVTKITLQIASLNTTTGVLTGNLASYNLGPGFTRPGPTTSGRIGEVIRFYDETNIDYVDIVFSASASLSTVSNQFIDIQLFPSLALDKDIMILASCQENTSTSTVNQLKDLRQFGNVSEEELTTSALNYIAAPARHLNFNGVVRGFDLAVQGSYGSAGLLSFTGGLALVNGNFEAVDEEILTIPPLQELYQSLDYPINYAMCANDQGEIVTLVLTDFDSVLGTPNAPNRLVTVNNVVSSTTYPIDSCSFSYLLNDRKDLTILYVISSVVTGTGRGAVTSITVRDVRRYVKDSDSSIPAVVTNDNSQGNFESFVAAINWLKFNATYQNTLFVKSSTTVNTPINFSVTTLNIKSGGSNAAINFTDIATLTNIHFTDVNLTFAAAPTISNCTFSDLNTVTFSSTSTISSTVFTDYTVVFTGTSSLTGVTFTNCTVTFTAGATLNNVTFDNCIVNFDAGTFTANLLNIFSSVVAMRIGFPAVLGGLTILDSQVTISIIQAFAMGNNYRFERNVFAYAPLPATDGYYISSNPVNAVNSMFYGNVGVGASLNNFVLRDCSFTTSLVDHYGYLSVQFSDISAFINNFDIRNNQFITTATAADIRAIISFSTTFAINGAGNANTQTVKNPTMFNVNIVGNYCNSDQMILIAGTRLNLGANFNTITGPLINTVNCFIDHNTCGTIGFITASIGPGSGVIVNGGGGGSFPSPYNFAVLASAGITNTSMLPNTTVINGDVGTFPTTTETGFTDNGFSLIGTNHVGDTVTQTAKSLLTAAYNAAVALGPGTLIPADLAGQTLVPGVYSTTSGAFLITGGGILTLDAGGNTNATWTIIAASTITTSSASSVVLVNGANANNVTWAIGSSATLGTNSFIQGNILAATSITVTTGSSINGRLFAGAINLSGAVTLDSVTITQPAGATSSVVSGPVAGLVADKESSLSVTNNNCRLICSLDSIGQYISFRRTFPDGGGGSPVRNDLVNVGTGSVLVSGNTANWLQLGASAYGTYTNGTSSSPMQNFDGHTITNNYLSPANPIYLASFADTVNNITIGNWGIGLLRELNGDGNTKSIISNNKLLQKPLQNVGGTATVYYYDQALVIINSATIMGNTVNGVLNSSTSSILVLGTGDIIATGNLFERGPQANQIGGNTIQSYVWAPGNTGKARITNNIFDSQWVNQANTIEQAGLNIPANWAFHSNTNQVGYTNANSEAFDWLGSDANAYKVYNPANAPGSYNYAAFFSSIGSNFNVTTTLQLDPYLPEGAQLLFIAMGTGRGTGDGSGTTLGGTMQLVAGQLRSNTFPTTPLSDLSAYLSTQPSVISGVSGTVAILSGTSVNNYSYVDVSAHNFLPNPNNPTYCTIAILATSTNGADYLQLSPLMIKYKW